MLKYLRLTRKTDHKPAIAVKVFPPISPATNPKFFKPQAPSINLATETSKLWIILYFVKSKKLFSRTLHSEKQLKAIEKAIAQLQATQAVQAPRVDDQAAA